MPPRLETRLSHLEAQVYEDVYDPGLAALLAYARRHPPAEPCDPATLAQTGLGRLLLEARQVQAEDEP